MSYAEWYRAIAMQNFGFEDRINERPPTKDGYCEHSFDYKFGYNGFKMQGTFDLIHNSSPLIKEKEIDKLLIPLIK